MKLALLAFFGVAAGRPFMMDTWRRSKPKAMGDAFPAPRYATQLQDNFDRSNSKTWQQAYYVNDTFWDGGESSPVFLCVGGEGPAMDGSAVVDSVHCNVAVEWMKEKNALMFALEHRYYGCHNMSACPVDNFDDPSAMRFLSSRQAIEDIAGFVRQMNKEHSLGPGNRWVTWGGSYPGMLAGWSRLSHPDLIHASVASSAPVHAKYDMHEYNEAVRRAYTVSDNGVGGSPACAQAIRDGHRAIEETLSKPGGARSVEKLLGVRNGSLESKDTQAALLGNGVAMFPAQSNDPTCEDAFCNIARICELMTDVSKGEPLDRLLALRRHQGSSGLPGQLDQDEPDYWFFQTCTEFGFYQSCDVGSDCMFVRGLVTADGEAAGCSRWNITSTDVMRNIMTTNGHYGALMSHEPGCVLWPNGEVDPWAPLGVLQSPSLGQPTLWVEGASHHAWTHPSDPSDQKSVVDAREVIRHTVSEFLQAEECSRGLAPSQPALLV